MEHAIDVLKGNGEFYDYVIYLQPTSPLRNSLHIDNAINLLYKKNTDSLVGVYELENRFLKLFIQNEGGYIRHIEK